MNEHLLSQAITMDMQWLVNAPSILAPHPLVWQPEALKNLDFQELNLTPTELEQCLTRKIGYYFETLAGLLFERHPRYEILAKNRVIYQEQVTLGELDLLLKDLISGEVLHLELALKFYLRITGGQPASMAWIGAGQKDFLHQKLNRLFHHQLKLPNIAKEKQCWPADLPFPDRHALWIPGRLYTAYGSPEAIDHQVFPGTPWQINDHVERSVWYEEEYDNATQLAQLNKKGWLRGEVFAKQSKPLPAQFSHPDHTRPVYVLPRNWQTDAQNTLKNYKAAL